MGKILLFLLLKLFLTILKKSLIILILFTLYSRTFAQSGVNMPLEERWVKPLIEQSAIIIEGVLIESKTILHSTSDSGGEKYIYCIIKPTKFFKGIIDSIKAFEVYIGKDPYLINMAISYQDGSSMPNYGIFFLSDETILPDFVSPIPNTRSVNFISTIGYNYTSQEITQNFFKDKFNLKPIATFVIPNLELLKSGGGIDFRKKKNE